MLNLGEYENTGNPAKKVTVVPVLRFADSADSLPAR